MPDTIVALSTPMGRSGIGVIRISGPDSLRIALHVAPEVEELSPRRATLAKLADPRFYAVLDNALLTYFKVPHSFTGEDVVEIACHGSPVVIRQVIDACLHLGARAANAGEFSLRALANGQMDLAEAEAIRDLIDAQTAASAQQAMRQMNGELSHLLKPLKDDLLDVIVVLESALEFVEDDLPQAQSEMIAERLRAIADRTAEFAATFEAGRLIRDGLRVALVGRPNVGKSSLFNSLLGTDRAIVTEIAGTTRDALNERFLIGDIPVSLVDTAGLRETDDVVESIGVERARRTIADADLAIVILDATEKITDADREIIRSVDALARLIAINKIDLARKTEAHENDPALAGLEHVRISAKTGAGIDELKRAIVEPFAGTRQGSDAFLITDARHHDLLSRAESELRHSIDLLIERTSEEMVLVGLHNSLRYLGSITGETTTEDMLTRIFSTFCIGK